MTLDVNAIEDKWLQQCGSCDAGLTMACSHPSEDYRPTMLALIAELRGLRSQLAESQQENTGKVLVDRAFAEKLLRTCQVNGYLGHAAKLRAALESS